MLELNIGSASEIRSTSITLAYESPTSNASVLWPPLVSPSLLSVGSSLVRDSEQGVGIRTNSDILERQVLGARNAEL